MFTTGVTQLHWKERLVAASAAGEICELVVNDLSNLSVTVEDIANMETRVYCLDVLGNLLLATNERAVNMWEGRDLLDTFEVAETSAGVC